MVTTLALQARNRFASDCCSQMKNNPMIWGAFPWSSYPWALLPINLYRQLPINLPDKGAFWILNLALLHSLTYVIWTVFDNKTHGLNCGLFCALHDNLWRRCIGNICCVRAASNRLLSSCVLREHWSSDFMSTVPTCFIFSVFA